MPPRAARTDAPGSRWYGRGSVEFSRVANLSDALFAIAMTLLVLRIDTPDVPADQLFGALANQLPQLIAFALSFAVVANFWWIHHRFIASLGSLEPGLIAINLMLLGAVALVPFPTSLIGNDPTAQATVVPYLLLLSLIALLHLALLVRAWWTDAWQRPLPAGLFGWLAAGWGSSTAVTLLALVVAVWLPVGGLAMLLLTWPAEALVAWRAPHEYRDWG